MLMDVTHTAEIEAKVLVDAGLLIHGDDWQAPLTRDLRLSSTRTTERWASSARKSERVRVSRTLLGELALLVERAGAARLARHARVASTLRLASEE